MNILYRNREPTLQLRKGIVRCTSRFYFGILLSLVYVKDMPEAVKSNLFLYANDSCLMYQHRDFEEIEKQLTTICDWFVDNKLSIHFWEDKTKTVLLASKHKIKIARKLNVKCRNIEIKP